MKRFRHKCPNCSNAKVMLKRCRHCYTLTCSLCSINGFCKDCFSSMNSAREIDAYMREKYKEVHIEV